MMSSSSIRVFHYQDSRSDKYWAIDTESEFGDLLGIWFGAVNRKLVYKSVPENPSVSKRIQIKLDKGYNEKHGLTIDRDTCQVISRIEDVDADEPVGESLWYSFTILSTDKKIQMQNIVSSFLFQLQFQFGELDKSEYEALLQTQTYHALTRLNQGLLKEQIEFSDGPLAAMLLFAVRKHIDSFSDTEMSLTIVGDNGFIMPANFEELNELIRIMFKAQLAEHKEGSRNILHYGLQPTIEKIAIAIGCIEAPIIMSELKTEMEAAFF